MVRLGLKETQGGKCEFNRSATCLLNFFSRSWTFSRLTRSELATVSNLVATGQFFLLKASSDKPRKLSTLMADTFSASRPSARCKNLRQMHRSYTSRIQDPRSSLVSGLIGGKLSKLLCPETKSLIWARRFSEKSDLLRLVREYSLQAIQSAKQSVRVWSHLKQVLISSKQL